MIAIYHAKEAIYPKHIEYDFFKDGRLKFRVFNRAKDYDPLASESLGYEQGFGIFFKKQFNSFRDLFRRKKKEKK